MHEDLSTLIGKGYSAWRANLNLCVPLLLIMVGSMAVLILFLIAVAAIVSPLLPLQDFSSISESELYAAASTAIAPIGAALLFTAILIGIVSSFFSAGAIGMATEANIGIKASLSTMWSSGRRYWTRIFAASVITIALLTIGLIVIIGVVFFVSTIVAGPIDPALLASNGFNPSSLPASFAAAIMAGVLAILIFLLAFQLGFTLVDFAVVIDDLSAVSSIKRSISFFRYNPFDVFVLWLVTIGISMALSLPGQILAKDFYAFWSMISTAISILVIGPLTIVWWARLYMTRSGIFDRKDPEEETTYIWT